MTQEIIELTDIDGEDRGEYYPGQKEIIGRIYSDYEVQKRKTSYEESERIKSTQQIKPILRLVE